MIEQKNTVMKKAIVFGLILFLQFMLGGCTPGVPKDIRRVIFEKSKFSAPITLRLPCEDHPEKIRRLKYGTHYLPPAYSSPLHSIGKDLLEILIRHGFVNKEEVRFGWGRYDSYNIFTYSEKIRPYIYRGNFNDYGNWFEIRLASRILQSIDYKNEYKLLGEKFYAIRFSYVLKEDFPYLEEFLKTGSYLIPLRTFEPKKIYKGKGEAYFDPSDGQWELQGIILEDENPNFFKRETTEENKNENAVVNLGKKISRAKVSGVYVKKGTDEKIPKGTTLEFKKDGECIVRVPYKWNIEDNRIVIKAEVEKGEVMEGEISEDTIEKLPHNATLVRQEKSQQIKELKQGKLWNKYTLQASSVPQGIVSFEFNKNGAALSISHNRWEMNGDNIIFRSGNSSIEGTIIGNTITFKDLGVFEKQTSFVMRSGISKFKVATSVVFCTQCGKENSAQASFCTNCGQKLE